MHKDYNKKLIICIEIYYVKCIVILPIFTPLVLEIILVLYVIYYREKIEYNKK